MARSSWCLVTALAACRSAFAQTAATALASSTPASSAQIQAPTSNLPALEIDVIFPRENETYDFTSSLPIVFAFQNLTAAAELGPFTFAWDIMQVIAYLRTACETNTDFVHPSSGRITPSMTQYQEVS